MLSVAMEIVGAFASQDSRAKNITLNSTLFMFCPCPKDLRFGHGTNIYYQNPVYIRSAG